MLGFEICKLSLRFMDDSLCDNCFASHWPALLFIRSPLSPAHLSSPGTAQTRSWHDRRMLELHRHNCSNSWQSSLSILVVGCYHSNQSLAQPEPGLGADASVCSTGDQRNPVMVSDGAQPLWVTQGKGTEQMILYAFTERGNGGTAKVLRSGFVTAFLREAVGWMGPAPAFSLVFARIYKTRLTCLSAERSQKESWWKQTKGDTALTQCHMIQVQTTKHKGAEQSLNLALILQSLLLHWSVAGEKALLLTPVLPPFTSQELSSTSGQSRT